MKVEMAERLPGIDRDVDIAVRACHARSRGSEDHREVEIRVIGKKREVLAEAGRGLGSGIPGDIFGR